MEPTTVFIDLREGPAFAEVPADVADALSAAAGDPETAERALHVAALVLIRVGHEGGEALLRHWLAHDPTVLLNADPLFSETLAFGPEPITGPLAGTAPCTLT